LHNGCDCRDSRLAPPRRDATSPSLAFHARSSSPDPDLIASLSDSLPTTPPPPLYSTLASILSKVDSPDKAVAPSAAVNPPSPASSISRASSSNDAGHAIPSGLHPRVAVILGVDRKWYLPLLICRALSTVPAAWWGLRCAFTFLAELLHIRPGVGHEGWAAAIVGSVGQHWDVERRFRVTEVALAIMWCCASAYLSYFFADCMMSRWYVLLNYTPPAVVIRLLTTNGLIAYITSWVLYLSGASSDPRLLLPAWISITTTLTFLYHATQNHATIKRETAAALLVLAVASFVSMSSLLLQLHLTRENEPEVPVFVITRKLWDWAVTIFLNMRVSDDRAAAVGAAGVGEL
ncbi:hypothetical protein BO70DRAFT_301065, partial [Aspergillus heteromorphus CBS 117.55]